MQNHRVNAAEHVIQKFKNHTIVCLVTFDEKFPSVLWCKLIKQAKDILNMIRTSCTHPQLSSYHVLEGPNDFNRVPFALPGCRATISNPTETQTSWVPRVVIFQPSLRALQSVEIPHTINRRIPNICTGNLLSQNFHNAN